ARGLTADGTLHVDELWNFGQRRTTLAGDLDIERQKHREIALRDRDDSAGRAVNYGYRGTPVALARYAPILDAVGDGRIPESFLDGLLGHAAARFGAGE